MFKYHRRGVQLDEVIDAVQDLEFGTLDELVIGSTVAERRLGVFVAVDDEGRQFDTTGVGPDIVGNYLLKVSWRCSVTSMSEPTDL